MNCVILSVSSSKASAKSSKKSCISHQIYAVSQKKQSN